MKREREREKDGLLMEGVVNFLQEEAIFFELDGWINAAFQRLLVHGDINCCCIHHQAEKNKKIIFSQGSTISPLVSKLCI